MHGEGGGTGLFDVGAVVEGLAEPGEEAKDNDDEGHGGWVFMGYEWGGWCDGLGHYANLVLGLGEICVQV